MRFKGLDLNLLAALDVLLDEASVTRAAARLHLTQSATSCALGRLRAALSEYIPVEQHVYALYLPSRHLPAKVRTVIDFLLERYGPDPYWDRD